MKKLLRLLPHLVMALAVTFMVFLILNSRNPMMGFLTSLHSQILLWIFCVLSLLCGIALFAFFRRSGK